MDLTSVTKALSALFRELDTPYSQAALAALRSGVFPSFPDTNSTPDTFRRDYLAYNLCRKVRDPVLGILPKKEEQMVEEAVSGFLETERVCASVNNGGHPGWVTFKGNTLAPEAVMLTASRKICALLGDFSLDEFASRVDFSNGASTRLPRRSAAVPYKFAGIPHVTRNCALLAINLIWFHEPWREFCKFRFGRESDPCTWVEVVRGSEYFTVPKTATTLRGACKEPELNMFCQKAIGSMIRSRLRRVGIDLNDQGRNRSLALEGSLTGLLATIDLKNASDSVALRCLDLLPEDWRRYINMTRSEEVLLPNGKWHRLAKVSSMGNGFTFELESLIFWAITSSCVDLLGCLDRRVGVYGDDIIVTSEAATSVIGSLSYLGFVTNSEKTFYEGYFRESCGGHFHSGRDVTPFFMRRGLLDLEDRYHFLNSLNRWLHDDDLFSDRVHGYIHRQLLAVDEFIFVPPSAGSKVGLWAPSIGAAPGIYFCFLKGRQQYAYRALRTASGSRHVRSAPGYLCWLLGAMHERLGEVTVMKEVRVSRRFKTYYTSAWDDIAIRLPSSVY